MFVTPRRFRRLLARGDHGVRPPRVGPTPAGPRASMALSPRPDPGAARARAAGFRSGAKGANTRHVRYRTRKRLRMALLHTTRRLWSVGLLLLAQALLLAAPSSGSAAA